MRGLQDRDARRLINPSRFHSDKAVLDQIDATYPVFAAKPVEPVEQRGRRKRFRVDGYRRAGFEINVDVDRLGRSIFGGVSQEEDVRRRLCPRIFQDAAFVAYVHQVAVDRIRLLGGCDDRYLVPLGVSDKVRARLELPLAPRGYNSDIWLQRIIRKLESDLIISLAGGSVSYGLSSFLSSDLDLRLRDQRPRQRGAHEVDTFIDGVRLERGEHEISGELFAEVFDIELRCTGCQGFLFEARKFLGLTNVGCKAHDLAVVLFFQPAKD